MVVMGNPPYSGESANKGDWIMGLMEDYKKEPGGKEKLKEQNSKFINDDYVKFLRYGQFIIDNNKEGILAFINPHGFLDNPTFRGMRWSLLKTYDKIFTIDLHGNSKRNETSPDGSPDVNVFDIMQGVSINIFVKNGRKKPEELAEVFHYDLFGKRDVKYSFLLEKTMKTIAFTKLNYSAPEYYFVPKDFQLDKEYKAGFSVNQLIKEYSLGLLTKKDRFITDFNKDKIKNKLNDFLNIELSDEYLAKKFELKLEDNDSWNLKTARKNLIKSGVIDSLFKLQNYRCFDSRYVYYQKDFVARLNTRVLSNFIGSDDLSLITTRQLAVNDFSHIFISNIISDQCYISNRTKEGCYVYPLYLYHQNANQLDFNDNSGRIPNFNLIIVQQIATGLNLTFTNEKETTEGTFAPIDLLDYIYAVLHSPAYREKYKEFLKIDFPRVPYPANTETFWQLVKLGGQLRTIHLLESPVVTDYITSYPIDGDNVVNALRYDAGRVYINQTQYFDNVPAGAWQFYIGGYQPAQKWLKDRKGRELSFEDIMHYQSIIVALHETEKLMQQIDEVGVELVIAEVV